jgi:hypothetical protein
VTPALVALVLVVTACDYGARDQRSSLGPPLHIVATYPEDGAGIDCPSSEPTCGVPIDTPVELRFDRFLLPTTAVRQSIAYYTGRARTAALLDPSLPELVPTYDPLERVVRFTLPAGATLVPNTLYSVEFPVAGVAAAPPRHLPVLDWGFRAFDGAPLDEQGILRISFRTGEHRSAPPAPRPPTCDEVVSLLRCDSDVQDCAPGNTGCASCHVNSSRAWHGLRLTSADTLVETAIGRVAHQTETGSTTGVPLEAPERFGAAMPLIDPFRPENSYLLYKLLIGSSAYRPSAGEAPDCASAYSVAVAPEATGPGCLEPPPAEIARLKSWFVRGEAMPPADVDGFFFRRETRALADFIRAGAVCP